MREEKLVWRRFTEVALKGGYVALRNSALLGGLARLESEPVRGAGLQFAGGFGYRHTWGSWWTLGTLT